MKATPENGENSNRSNKQKSNFARAAHFLVHFFAVVLRDYNVKLPEPFYACMEEMLYVFSFTLFSIAAHFVLELVAPSISLFTSPPQTKTLCCSFNKKCLLCFLSLALDLSPFFSLSFAGLPPTFSFSLSFSCSYSRFVDMTINLSLII